MTKLQFLFLSFFLVVPGITFAQLGFCNGSKGDPIFHEDFGSGSGTGPALPAGITSYGYSTANPNDGEYTISSDMTIQNESWHQLLPTTTMSNGKALIINADYNPGQFYNFEVKGLCEGTTYEFSAFIMNVYDANSGGCLDTGIPVNVSFEIWDETDTQLLKSGTTGDIDATASPVWEQYALTFRSRPGQNSVILKMFNNQGGGCGNDLAIDDIVFRSCGDLTQVKSTLDASSTVFCPNEIPASLTLEARTDSTIFDTHFYQWQRSTDAENWNDIPGATGQTYETPPLDGTEFFRVKVAEEQINLSTNLCSSVSQPYQVQVVEEVLPPISNGDRNVCSNNNIPALTVSVENDETVNWYDAPTGGNLLAEGTTSFVPQAGGTYYAEARKEDFNCDPSARTAVILTVNDIPDVVDETLQFCSGSAVVLDAGISNVSYLWSTGETTRSITVYSEGEYEVNLVTARGCQATKVFTVSAVPDASIREIISRGTTVEILSQAGGDFEYSLDGENFQNTGVFRNINGGIYTAYLRDVQGCNTVQREFAHIVLPEFITPNGDGYNDVFRLNGASFFPSSEIRIFDRYGKLIASGRGENFAWDGTFRGKALPASEFWYHIIIENYGTFKGHFSLLR